MKNCPLNIFWDLSCHQTQAVAENQHIGLWLVRDKVKSFTDLEKFSGPFTPN